MRGEFEIKKEEHIVTYVSSASEHYDWMKKHPIKSVERYFGIRLKWYQKILLLIVHCKEKIKKKRTEKIIGKFLR